MSVALKPTLPGLSGSGLLLGQSINDNADAAEIAHLLELGEGLTGETVGDVVSLAVCAWFAVPWTLPHQDVVHHFFLLGVDNSNPIGTAVIRNFEESPAEEVQVTFFVKQYMDNPKEARIIDVLEPGEEEEIDIYGLFTN